MTALARNRIIVGDVRDGLRQLPDASVDVVVTSPPYWALRDYGVPGQLGAEATVAEWVEAVAEVAADIERVLVPTGSFWLNLGDTYVGRVTDGAPRKSLVLGPERVALRLVRDGWILRNKLVWQKANPMPTSARDRLACTWEAVYVFTKQQRYFFDLDAIRQPHLSRPPRVQTEQQSPRKERAAWRGPNAGSDDGLSRIKAEGRIGHPLGKNPGDVWRIASSNYRGGHHATFPLTLAERIIRAGCPESRCTACQAPWRRAVIRAVGGTAVRGALGPSCDCGSNSEPGLVLDPFMGAGTTAVAAEALGRDWLGIELNPEYAALANRRVYEARGSPRAAA